MGPHASATGPSPENGLEQVPVRGEVRLGGRQKCLLGFRLLAFSIFIHNTRLGSGRSLQREIGLWVGEREGDPLYFGDLAKVEVSPSLFAPSTVGVFPWVPSQMSARPANFTSVIVLCQDTSLWISAMKRKLSKL